MTRQGAPTTPSMTHSRQATLLTSYFIFKSFELWFLARSAIALLTKQVCGSNTDEIDLGMRVCGSTILPDAGSEPQVSTLEPLQLECLGIYIPPIRAAAPENLREGTTGFRNEVLA